MPAHAVLTQLATTNYHHHHRRHPNRNPEPKPWEHHHEGESWLLARETCDFGYTECPSSDPHATHVWSSYQLPVTRENPVGGGMI